MLIVVLNTVLSLSTLLLLVWVIREYIRARRQVQNIISLLYTKSPKMDDLLEGLLAEETAGDAGVGPKQLDSTISATAAQRERLATIAAGGQARQYLAWTVEEIDSLGEDEVGKLYARYEARLGAAMTKTLGQAALQLYTAAASLFLRTRPRTNNFSWRT